MYSGNAEIKAISKKYKRCIGGVLNAFDTAMGRQIKKKKKKKKTGDMVAAWKKQGLKAV